MLSQKSSRSLYTVIISNASPKFHFIFPQVYPYKNQTWLAGNPLSSMIFSLKSPFLLRGFPSLPRLKKPAGTVRRAMGVVFTNPMADRRIFFQQFLWEYHWNFHPTYSKMGYSSLFPMIFPMIFP